MKGKHPESPFEWLQLAGSYMWGQRLASYESNVSGRLEVWMVNGNLVLNSAHANQSFDSLHDVFSSVFEEINLQHQPIRNVLLLGLGAGNIPAIIEEELVMHCKITAIEKDPLMIELGNKYFDLQRFKHLTIVLDDAYHYVKNCKQRFGLIIIDLFVDNYVPDPFTSEDFLKELGDLLHPEGFVLFNMIVQTPQQLEQLKRVQHFFNRQEGVTKILEPIASNKVLYWQKL
jgi:spermidine synthase